MILVKLLGALGHKFGRQFELEANSPAQIIRALSYQLEGFAAYLYASSDRGIYYRVVADESSDGLSEEELELGIKKRLIIAPIIRGAFGNIGKILLGAALITASFFTGGITLFGSATLSSTLLGLGASLALSGIAGLLTPTPSVVGGAREAVRRQSFLLPSGAQTGKEGDCVPLLYGYFYCPLQIVISTAISAEDF